LWFPLDIGVILSGAVFQAERRISSWEVTNLGEIPRPAGKIAGLWDDAFKVGGN